MIKEKESQVRKPWRLEKSNIAIRTSFGVRMMLSLMPDIELISRELKAVISTPFTVDLYLFTQLYNLISSKYCWSSFNNHSKEVDNPHQKDLLDFTFFQAFYAEKYLLSLHRCILIRISPKRKEGKIHPPIYWDDEIKRLVWKILCAWFTWSDSLFIIQLNS